MTLMKSILLGSAVGLVAVAAAQAADLPTRKSAPAEYVKVCNVGGMAGFVLPGSDTCFKISGSVVVHFDTGNLNRQYGWTFGSGMATVGGGGSVRSRDQIGFATRGTVQFDAR